MFGFHVFDMTKRKNISSAHVHAMSASCALPFNPMCNFGHPHNDRVGAPGNRNRIAQVVSMCVSHEDKICLSLFWPVRSQWITFQKRIDQHVALINFQMKCGVAQPGNFDCHSAMNPSVLYKTDKRVA